MPNEFTVEIYCGHNGIRMELPWWSETQFREGVLFLQGMVGDPVYGKKHYADEPDFYYLETEDQFEALMQFRRAQGVKRPG